MRATAERTLVKALPQAVSRIFDEINVKLKRQQVATISSVSTITILQVLFQLIRGFPGEQCGRGLRVMAKVYLQFALA